MPAKPPSLFVQRQLNFLVYIANRYIAENGWKVTELRNAIETCDAISIDRDPTMYGQRRRYRWRKHFNERQLRRVLRKESKLFFPYDVLLRDYLYSVNRIDKGEFESDRLRTAIFDVAPVALHELWTASNFGMPGPNLTARCKVTRSDGRLFRLWIEPTGVGEVEFSLIKETTERRVTETLSSFRNRAFFSDRGIAERVVGKAMVSGPDRMLLWGVYRDANGIRSSAWVVQKRSTDKHSEKRLYIKKNTTPSNWVCLQEIEMIKKLTIPERKYIINMELSRYLFLPSEEGEIENFKLNGDDWIEYSGESPSDKELVEAAKNDDIIGFIVAMFDGADANARDEIGDTVAHICARRRLTSEIGLLYGFIDKDLKARILASAAIVLNSDVETVVERIRTCCSTFDPSIRNQDDMLPSELLPLPGSVISGTAEIGEMQDYMAVYTLMGLAEKNAGARDAVSAPKPRVSIADFSPT